MILDVMSCIAHRVTRILRDAALAMGQTADQAPREEPEAKGSLPQRSEENTKREEPDGSAPAV